MNTLTHGIQYNSHVTIPIKLLFFTKTNEDCIDRFHIAMTVLRYMLQFPNTLNFIEVVFAFTSVQKHLPTHGLIGPSTLNTGYTIGNQIVVYREEEWLKVFIHECIHLFDYDAELRDKSELLYTLFPISRTIHLNESYCEIWARILNCCLISVLQMVNVLHYMGILYPQLMDKDTDFKENTNAFAYLVIPAILIQDPYLFVKWCKKNNKSLLPVEHADKYVALIQTTYNSKDFLNVIPKHTSSLSTKMSFNNIHL
jgi:hypothetical protein